MRSASVRPQTQRAAQGQCITNGTRARECAKIVIDNAHAHYVHTTHARVHACATTTKKNKETSSARILSHCCGHAQNGYLLIIHMRTAALWEIILQTSVCMRVCVCVPTHRHQIHTCWRQACGRAHASSLQQHGQLLRPVYISDVRTTTTRYK